MQEIRVSDLEQCLACERPERGILVPSRAGTVVLAKVGKHWRLRLAIESDKITLPAIEGEGASSGSPIQLPLTEGGA